MSSLDRHSPSLVRRTRQLSASADNVQIPDTLRIDPVIIVSMHETENRLNRFYPGDSTEPSMESILNLVVSSTVVALVQAHSHKKLIGFSPAAEHCHERSSQAPGVGLGRNCRSLRRNA